MGEGGFEPDSVCLLGEEVLGIRGRGTGCGLEAGGDEVGGSGK